MKILVNVSIPAISENYDIWVPATLRVRTIASLIAEAVEGLSNHLYVASGKECLCSVEKNIQLRSNATLEKYGVKNGDHLVLI